MARVPDARLEQLAQIFRPEKVTPATVEYVDLPGLAPGEGSVASAQKARDLSTYLKNLKNVDALLLVVRAFEDAAIAHVEGSIDPARDIAHFELEMILSDLTIVEKRLERLERDTKKMKSVEHEAEQSVLLRFKEALEREQPLRSLELTQEEQRRVKGFTFLSAKPVLLVLNLGDSDAGKDRKSTRLN